MRARRHLIAVVVACGLVAASTACTPSNLGAQPLVSSPTPAPSASPPAAPGQGLDVVPAVAARVEPSVVTVLTPTGTGSGVVLTVDGVVVTNEHVVRASTAVQVAFADGQRVAGTVQATDAITDVAIVQADRHDLTPARFQPALPAVGSLAIVIGSPLGFENSVTVGVISRAAPRDPRQRHRGPVAGRPGPDRRRDQPRQQRRRAAQRRR
jgi:serine protease DegQ